MLRTYYVYYRLHKTDAPRAHELARAIIEAVEHACGVRGRLSRRYDDPLTWMEVYERVADATAFELALKQAEANWVEDAPRQRECFIED